ncbi:MAG: replication protein RepA [Verrucomicrobiaceae bacterium]
MKKVSGRAARMPDPEFELLPFAGSPNSSHYTVSAQITELFDVRNTKHHLGFIARMLALATMPHSDPGDLETYTRINGNYRLVMQRGVDAKLPYGSYPRLLLAWVCSETVRRKERTLVLGDSLSHFMRQLGLIPTGGRWGTIPQIKEQIRRLFATRVAIIEKTEQRDHLSQMQLASTIDLWWDNRLPGQATLWNSTITLSEEFYREIVSHPIPINLKILKALKRSPLGLDLYMFLTYRMGYLREPTYIPWKALHKQFGAEYKDIKNFKRKALRELLKIKLAWPQLNYELLPGRLGLRPSQASIPPAEPVAGTI